jgi:hypothetical protein
MEVRQCAGSKKVVRTGAATLFETLAVIRMDYCTNVDDETGFLSGDTRWLRNREV